ncbi:MAG: transglutaminase domain-containing protein [Deltaproteobacteria bacterium]|nr:transglutaminase domain-containing protein [Deltaproteobacteria bacterium]MDQ3297703.1 transglutaminase-like domain-containing protein [Myxococcota bacterium]
MRRAFRFSFETSVPASDAPTSVWIPRPVEDAWQQITSEALPDLPCERGVDPETGTAMMCFALPPASTPSSFALGFTVERLQRSQPRPAVTGYTRPPSEDDRFAHFLKSDSRVRSDGGNLDRALAIASPDEPPLVIARKIFDHLVETMGYDSAGCTPERSDHLGDLEVACDLRTGTCTEFHGLFVAFARALGVPARFTFGFNIPRDKQTGTIGGYHCWADIALPDGSWFPVDVSEASKRPELADFYFGSLDENRIAFSYGRDVQLVPSQHAPRLDRFIFPYAETRNVAVEPTLAFSFADV